MVKKISNGQTDIQTEDDIYDMFLGNNTNQFEIELIKSRRLFINAKVYN